MDFATAWAQAGDITLTDRRDAFALLAHRRDELTAPVYVRLPGTEAYENPTWVDIVDNSTALCHCGLRRLIVPESARFEMSGGSTQVVDESHPLYIVPWGGDISSTLVAVNVRGSNVFIHRDPFAKGLHPSNLIITEDQKTGLLCEISAIPANGIVPFTREFTEDVPIAVCRVTSGNATERTIEVELNGGFQVANPATPSHFLCESLAA